MGPDDGTGALIGLNPHYSGSARLRVGLTGRIARPGDTALDGAFHGWADPGDDDPTSGLYPFVFDTPDFRRHAHLPVPSFAVVQIAAFAHSLETFPTETAFHARGTMLAAESFIPSGLFSPGGAVTEPPGALAIITGVVLEAASVVNPATNGRFHRALVRSLGGEFDVVADPSIASAPPVMGGVVSGEFWLSGRVVDRS